MASLVLSSLAHAALGLVLALATWAAGSAVVARTRAQAAATYPLGLLILTAVAVLALLTPALGVVALGVVVAALVLGARGEPRPLLPPALLAALPGATAFAVALGLFQHGPSASRGSNAFGDAVFYVAQLTSAAQSIWPFRDLSVAGLEHGYPQAAAPVLGAALASLPGFDPFLFLAGSLPMFVFASLALALPRAAPSRHAALAAVLAAGAFPYLSWLAESPPVALAVPCAVALATLAVHPSALTTAATAVALVLSKGVALVPLAAIVAANRVPDVWRSRGRRRATAVAVLLALAALVLLATLAASSVELFTLRFFVVDALEDLGTGLRSRSTRELAPAALVCGHVLLLAASARLARPGLLAAVAASVAAAWFVGGHGADAAFLLSAVAVAVTVREATLDRTTTLLVGAAAAALVVASWFRDTAGVGTAATLLALATAALVGAFAAPLDRRAIGVLALASGAVVAAAGLSGALRLSPERPPLSTDRYELTRELERLPSDALVFTSLTGERIEDDEGWNYYSAVSGRQHYLAGWANSELRVRSDELAERLELNRRALTGDRREALDELDAGSRPLYAVVRVDDRPPARSRRVYANESYALYELRP